MTARTYNLKVIRLEELEWKYRLHSKTPNLYVEAKLGNAVRKTQAVKGVAPSWNESVSFTVPDEDVDLRIKVKHRSSWSKDPCVGVAEIKLSNLLAMSASTEASLVISSSRRGATVTMGQIILRIDVIDAMVAVESELRRAEKVLEQNDPPTSQNTSDSTQSSNTGTNRFSERGELYRAVHGLVDRLRAFDKTLDVVSQIHPFFTIAWYAVSALYKAVDYTFETDQKIVHLVTLMSSAFNSVRNLESLRDKFSSLHEPIAGLLRQTAECCIFVRHYASRGFFRRMLDATSGQKVDEFEQSLVSFKEQIDSGIILETALVSVRAADRIDTLYIREQLNPGMFDAFDRPTCLPGTRLEIRRKIVEWSLSETPQTIFWLYGVAGSGKSTISATIASHFREISRLGAFLFFIKEKSEPSSVIRSIAYQLALFDSSIGGRILSEIDRDKAIGTAPSGHQFNSLLLDPLRSSADSALGPIVIVVDALDECGTPESRSQLINLLLTEFSKLPTKFRFLITSRREADIDKVLRSHPEHILAVELDHASATSQDDVLSFLRAEMHNVLEGQVTVPAEWPWEENMALLGKAANGLFIWASTAVKMISNSDDPFYHLECLVADSRSVLGFGLVELYASVLRNSGIAWSNERSRERFRRVMSLLLYSKIPLSVETIDGVLGFSAEQTSLLVLSRLRSVVTYSESSQVQPGLLHASFSDYLTSLDHSDDPWFIDALSAQPFLAERCFSILESGLRFNICDLPNSFIRNDKVPGLSDRIKDRITPRLKYASLYWAQHLAEVTQPSSRLFEMLSDFAYRRPLFWFEVLGLTKTFGRAAPSTLSEASRWSEPYSTGIASFLRDARKLALVFSTPIVESTAHIYVSMIPLFAGYSEVATHFSKVMSSMIRVKKIGVKAPPLCLKIFEGHRNSVRSVAFSPNGRQVASAARDGTTRLWDIDSGEELFCRIAGDTVCFSPDGDRILSGSAVGQLNVWDARNGILISSWNRKRRSVVTSVAWSHDGLGIASGYSDNIIVILDATSGSATFRIDEHKGAVRSVAFSPDSSQLVSASDDQTIMIWEVKSGKLVLGPLKGHSGAINSVAFCPDGRHAVSGSVDRTIKIWHIESGNDIYTLKGHTWAVTSVAYSPCGTRIISGSWDRTIILWDAESGNIVSRPLEGHSLEIYSVALSPDGRCIASGAGDKTVRIWDVTATTNNSTASARLIDGIISVAISPDGNQVACTSWTRSVVVLDAQTGEVASSNEGHSGPVTCLAFSTDGSQLISGSEDGTIRICDLETGQLISDPLVHRERVNCIAVSPDGATIASGASDGMIRIWSSGTGDLVTAVRDRWQGSVRLLAFSANGERLASVLRGPMIVIWNTDHWEARSRYWLCDRSFRRVLCFTPCISRIVTASRKSFAIRDVKGGLRVAGPFMGHTGRVEFAVLSPDEQYAISCSSDKTILVWDVDTEQAICELQGHTECVRALVLSPDCRRLISGSDDSIIRIWDISDVLQPSEQCMNATRTSSSEWVLGHDGWVLDGRYRRDLLMWIPPDLRRTLWRPQNIAILGCDYVTKLEFSGASLGECWADCFAIGSKDQS